MSLLLITLPSGPPGNYPYATSADGQTPERYGASPANLLPPGGRGVETVGVVPAALLSWQRVALPKGVGAGSPRLRAVLTGLLEDRVLDEPERLHFALAPDAGGAGESWVAVCERAWLHAHLQALDGAGRPVHRIVPELAPDAGPLRIHVVGDADHPLLLLAGDGVAGGVQSLPLNAASLPLLPAAAQAEAGEEAVEVLAEPAVAELAERWLQRPPTLRSAAQRALLASRSAWDLAQRQALIRDTLTQTFPQVKVVIDAPVQMGREVALLRQTTGAASPRDLEPTLAALGAVIDPAAAPQGLDYAAGTLRLRGLRWSADQLATANDKLGALGYQARSEGEDLVVAAREVQP